MEAVVLTNLFWIGVGIMIGAPLGAFLVALCVAAKGGDEPLPAPEDFLAHARRFQ